MGKSIFVAIIVLFLLFAGCVEEQGTIAQPASSNRAITEETKQKDLLASAVTSSVMTVSKNWDADAEDDGITVYPDLKDEKGETVKFENYNLPVEVKIFTIEYDDNFNKINDRLVYTGTSSIDSWKDGNFLFEGGIKIPFEQINTVVSDEDYGRLYITVTLPDGRKVEAKDDYARIKPE